MIPAQVGGVAKILDNPLHLVVHLVDVLIRRELKREGLLERLLLHAAYTKSQ